MYHRLRHSSSLFHPYSVPSFMRRIRAARLLSVVMCAVGGTLLDREKKKSLSTHRSLMAPGLVRQEARSSVVQPFLPFCCFLFRCIILPGPPIIVRGWVIHLSYLGAGLVTRCWACYFYHRCFSCGSLFVQTLLISCVILAYQ